MPQTQTPSLVAQVERLHAVVGVAVFAAAWVLGSTDVWSGVLTGLLIGALNFWLLGMVTVRLVAGETRTRNSAIGWFVIKFALLGGSIGFVTQVLVPDAFGLLGGLSLAPACLVVVLLWRRGHETPAGSALPAATAKLPVTAGSSTPHEAH
jgi:hypothetical protein